MDPQRYRNFYVKIGRLDSSGSAQTMIWGTTPSQVVTDPVTVKFNSGNFTFSDAGGPINLLDSVKRRQVKDEYLYRLGSLLSDLALPGKIRDVLLQSLDTVRSNKQRLRLRLIVEDPILAPLPWEFLYLERSPGAQNLPDFLVLNPDISLARLGAANVRDQAFPSGGKYRLTAALASPKKQDKLNLDSDRAAIESAINQAQPIGEITPSWANHATLDLVMATLRDGCDIFHFSGHGVYDRANGKGQVLLEDPKNDYGYPLNADVLSQLLVSAKTKVAILGACETGQFSGDNPFGGVATSLAGNGVPAVVASQFRLLDGNGVLLVQEIYRSLLRGEEIDEGVYRARQSIVIRQDGFKNRDWGALVLYLRGEDGIVFRPEVAAGSLRRKHILPTPLQSPLVGRKEVITQLDKNITSGKNCYLFGFMGVGKTSLATAIFSTAAVAERFPDGCIWGSADGMNAERVLESVASNFPEQTVSKAATKSDKINELRRLLAGNPKLLISLDNVDNADAARSVLDAAGNCAVMLNGEIALELGARATSVEITPLDQAASEQLFMTEAKLNAETPAGNRALISKICDRMRGLPLGIKIAAGKCAEGESLETVWERIDAAPSTLATDAIQALVESIYDELGSAPEVRRLLIRLASFPALEASILPLQADEDLTEFFQAKDKLLALRVIEKAGRDRLALHPLLGPLIVQRADKGVVKAQREQMTLWLTEFARENSGSVEKLRAEQRNLIGLMDVYVRRKQWDALASLMINFFAYLRVRGLWSEASKRLDQCLKHEGDLTGRNRGGCFLQRAIVNTLLGKYADAKNDLARAQEIFESLDDKVAIGRVQYRRAVLTILEGNLKQGADQIREAITNMGEAAPANDRAGAHGRLGAVLSVTESVEEAAAEFQESLEIAKQSADVEHQARAHLAIGSLHERSGDLKNAQAEYDLALDLATQLGDPLQRAQIQLSVGYMLYHKARFAEARASFEMALTDVRELGSQAEISKALHAVGNAYLEEGDLAKAEAHYNDSLAINETLNHKRDAAYGRYQLGIIAQRKTEKAAAERAFAQALDAAKGAQDQVLEGAALVQLAKLAQQDGDLAGAKRLARKAINVAGRTGDALTRGLANVILGEFNDAYQAFAPYDNAEAKAILERVRPDTSRPSSVAGGRSGTEPVITLIDRTVEPPLPYDAPMEASAVDQSVLGDDVGQADESGPHFDRVLDLGIAHGGGTGGGGEPIA